MNVYVIGGTGLLGSQGARELIRRGHGVSALALPPLPEGAALPPQMRVEFGSYLELTDAELARRLAGFDALVFAAGVDERVSGPAPIFDLFQRYNTVPLERILRIAKAAGVRRAVVCGSYFSYFARLWPERELGRWHPYIRSRLLQEEMALGLADEDLAVAVLELPYIFGAQPGRKPVWLFLAEMIRRMPGCTFYPGGGTAMVTVRQVGEAIAGAVERNQGGHAYPIGWENMPWRRMLGYAHEAMGCSRRRVVTVPEWMFALACRFVKARQARDGLEGGLDMPRFAEVMCAETYLDKSLGSLPLGVTDDEVPAAIRESMRACAAILDGKARAIGMRGE